MKLAQLWWRQQRGACVRAWDPLNFGAVTEWPAGDAEAVYVVPPQAPESLTAIELRARLAAARIRLELPTGDRELDEVLSRNADATALPDLDSVYTRDEKAELDASHDLVTRARAVLDLGEDEDGLLSLGWHEGCRLIRVYLTEDRANYADRLRDALGADRVAIRDAPFSEAELKRAQNLLIEHREDLEHDGVQVMTSAPALTHVEVTYSASDPVLAEQLLSDRFGEIVRPRWRGAATTRTFRPYPFASWLAEEDRLTVFYALHHNGEQPGDCAVIETDRHAIVSLRILDWDGAKTLVGGFTPSYATVHLDRPLAGRAVIDDSTHRARPHWTEV